MICLSSPWLLQRCICRLSSWSIHAWLMKMNSRRMRRASYDRSVGILQGTFKKPVVNPAAAAAVELMYLTFAPWGPNLSQTVKPNSCSSVTSPHHNLSRHTTNTPACHSQNTSFFLFKPGSEIFLWVFVPWELSIPLWLPVFPFFLPERLLSDLSSQSLCLFSQQILLLLFHGHIKALIVFGYTWLIQCLRWIKMCSGGGLIRILAVIGLVCYLCNQAEDVRGRGGGWLPNITDICHIDTSAVRICQTVVSWPCCSLSVVHKELTAVTLALFCSLTHTKMQDQALKRISCPLCRALKEEAWRVQYDAIWSERQLGRKEEGTPLPRPTVQSGVMC